MADWKDASQLERHFRRHRRLLRVATLAEYDASARETIDAGTYLEYRDPDTNEWRVGYYWAETGRFTGLTDDEINIVRHFRCRLRYVMDLPGSTYA